MRLFILLSLASLYHAIVHIQTVTLTQSNQSFTITFSQAFKNDASFAYFLESGNILSTEFAVTHDATATQATKTQLVITFVTHKAAFMGGQYIILSLIASDDNSMGFNLGVTTLDIATKTLVFTGFSLGYTNSKMEVYPLALPMSYTKIQNANANTLVLTISQSPSTYFQQGVVLFGYIYISNAYAANTPISLFPYITETNHGYVLSYANFAFTPSVSNTLIAIKTYSSTSSPFFPLSTYRDFTSTGTAIDSFVMGYYNLSGTGVAITSDILMVNASFEGCGESQFLYYVQYFTSLPFNCIPCNSQCKTCLANDLNQSANTDANSCQSCTYLRYLNTSNQIFGNCPCYPGLSTVNGECFPCPQNCLSFEVHFIESTNQTNFLLYFSYPDIVEDLPLEQNLLMYLNGRKVTFFYDHPRDAVYIISTVLSEFSQCQSAICEVQFLFEYPFKIMLSDRSKSLSMNNATLKINNFVNYYTILPQSVQTAFTVLSMIVAGSYGSGLTSIVKILFELQQLIDAHKYLNLTMPIIYNQLIQGLSNFKFMDLTNLMPANIVSSIQGFPPSDLDQLGPPKMIYYDQGVNFVKNIITGIISCIALLFFNFFIYWLLKLIPLKVTRRLSKKIQRRRIITIHDTLQQLELPVFIFAMAQLQFIYLKASLTWIYGVAMVFSVAALVAPFMVILLIYSKREGQSRVQIYQDLMQDNNMSFAVTYVYYVFNYFRKMFFALCLTYSLPGLVQIYLLITLNTIHLAFQIYLIVAKVYLSKSKVLIRIINSLSVIIVQILIVVYNLNSYSNQTNINIGMACFYLSITTAVLGLLDAFIKLADTIFQEIKTKKVHAENNSFETKPIFKEFRNEIKCKLGQELKPKPEPKDPKTIKFIQDKELMENTFHNREDQLQSDGSGRISEADVTKSHVEDVDLVFIDDDWVNVYPPSRPNDMPSSQTLADKKQAKKQAEIELYQIPRSIGRQARKMRQQRREKVKKKSSKYDIGDEFAQIPATSTKRYMRMQEQRLHIRPINQSKGEEEVSQINSSQF